jgi:hypothetical protein
MAWLAKVGEVMSKQFHDDHVEIHTRLPARHAGRLAREGHKIEVLRGRLPEEKPVVEKWEEELPTTGTIYPEVEVSPDEEVA